MHYEVYMCMAISTAHLTQQDIRILHAKAEDESFWMVMEREPGFFVKLYEELEPNLYEGMSETFYTAVRIAHKDGFRMIEYDRDATIVNNLIDHSGNWGSPD